MKSATTQTYIDRMYIYSTAHAIWMWLLPHFIGFVNNKSSRLFYLYIINPFTLKYARCRWIYRRIKDPQQSWEQQVQENDIIYGATVIVWIRRTQYSQYWLIWRYLPWLSPWSFWNCQPYGTRYSFNSRQRLADKVIRHYNVTWKSRLTCFRSPCSSYTCRTCCRRSTNVKIVRIL